MHIQRCSLQLRRQLFPLSHRYACIHSRPALMVLPTGGHLPFAACCSARLDRRTPHWQHILRTRRAPCTQHPTLSYPTRPACRPPGHVPTLAPGLSCRRHILRACSAARARSPRRGWLPHRRHARGRPLAARALQRGCLGRGARSGCRVCGRVLLFFPIVLRGVLQRGHVLSTDGRQARRYGSRGHPSPHCEPESACLGDAWKSA